MLNVFWPLSRSSQQGNRLCGGGWGPGGFVAFERKVDQCVLGNDKVCVWLLSLSCQRAGKGFDRDACGCVYGCNTVTWVPIIYAFGAPNHHAPPDWMNWIKVMKRRL